ncbi:MAG: hypothetical protein WAT79_17590 [Saprospiraceae bacterium]
MKNVSFLLPLVLLMSINMISCNKDVEKVKCTADIKMYFHNQTDQRISNLIVNDVIVGVIPKGSNSGEVCFDTFGTDTGFPDCRLTGMYDGEILESTCQFYWCGTEKSTLSPGTYHININLVSWDNKKYFSLDFR